MNNRYKRLFEDGDKEGDFWPTFTDMLATILLVVLLFQVNTILKMQDAIEEAEAAKKDNVALQEQIDTVNNTRSDITNRLIAVFKEKYIDVEIDPETGAIRFANSILFESDSDQLNSQFKQMLNDVMPLYFQELMPFIDSGEISEIIIEGHTDDVFDYDYNLSLSQKRALNVSIYVVNNLVAQEKRQIVRSIVTANGRSYSNLVYKDGSNEIDRSKSRRVEIKYRITNTIIQNE